MDSYGRMLFAVVIFIVMVAVTIISYSVVVIPTEYVTDTLQDSYTLVSDDMGWDDTDEVNGLLGMIPYFLAGAVVTFIFLMCLWLFAIAHKKEYERY